MQVVDVLRAVEHDNGVDLVNQDLVDEDFAVCKERVVQEVVLDGHITLRLDEVLDVSVAFKV